MQTKEVVDHIVNWLRNYAKNANLNGFVIGISGGIDSAVTSTLCAKTGLSTMCLEMPIHQAEAQVSRAKEHITRLKSQYTNVKSECIDLTLVFEEFKKKLPITDDSIIYNLSLANSRARLRMTTLYYFAGNHRYLVAGTGNKVEDFGVGFFTKYGDGGVDINPIADLMKSEVFIIGEYVNVPDSILKAAPTDGLFGDNRTDEDQLGASYDELEWAMKMKYEGKGTFDFFDREKVVFDLYEHLNNINQHKMKPIPVCLIPSSYRK